MSDILSQLATTLAKQGAPVLGGLIGTAIGGPAGTVIGGLAGKAIETLAAALGTEETPEAVLAGASQPDAAAVVRSVEAQAPEMIRLWEIEAKRASDAQAAEIEKGFTGWQVMRIAIQAIVWGGWGHILTVGLYGGNMGVKPLLGLGELVSAWTTVTIVWMAVFHGGHTVKEMFGQGALGAMLGRKAGR